MHVLTNAEKLIPLRDAASLAESRRLAGIRMVTGTTSPSTRYERISVSPASCSIRSEYVIASHAFKPQYKCINYTPAWEQRKLSELLLERDEQAPQSDQYPLMAFIANQGIAPKGDRYDRSALVNDIEGKLYKRTEKGDFIYSSNNLETGSIGLNKYGNACISPVYSIFQPSGIADSDFLGRRLVRKDFIQEMVKWRQGVIYGQWRIHEADFLRLNIAVPSVDEQRLIGKLLDNLDALITLHQRKYDKLVILKKSMLEKMFPKDGESVPEIRFAGFTDPWEQRKFSEIVDVCSGRDYKHLDEGPIPVYGTGGYMTSVSEALSHNRDAIGIGRKGTIDKPYLLKAPFWTVDTLFYAIPKSDINLEFALCSFLNVDWKSKDESTGLPSLSKESINEAVLSVPNVVEQNHLGNFFADLDRLITLHQRKRLSIRQRSPVWS